MLLENALTIGEVGKGVLLENALTIGEVGKGGLLPGRPLTS